MIALKDLWKQQRQQRQQEILQRQQDVALQQQQVRDSLVVMQQKRLKNAVELHNELKQFQLQLQQQTQDYLHHISVKRKHQADLLVSSLREFALALQNETQQFLSLTRADRQLRAEELFRSLSLFHAELMTSVDALRHKLQVEIETLREEVQVLFSDTQNYLTELQQKRLRDQIQLAEDLARYVSSLQNQVSTYLAELHQMDQLRARAIQAEFQLQQQARAAEMQALFQDLGVFRGQLKAYCTDLRAMVWGDGTSSDQPERFSPPPSQPRASFPKAQPRSAANDSSPRNGVSASSPIRSTAASASAAPASADTRPQTASSSSNSAADLDSDAMTAAVPRSVQYEPEAAPVSESTVSEPPPALATPDTSIDTFAESVNDSSSNRSAAPMTWGSASVAPVRKDIGAIEQEIFEFLKMSSGARLTELESALDINRFQAVDALRSLIKQGRVTQRDRVYVVQEEATP